MADPRLFDTPVAVALEEALRDLGVLLADVPASGTPFAETYDNPNLAGSLASLLEAVSVDPMVRGDHGDRVLTAALVKVVASQQREIEQLKASLARNGAKVAATKPPKKG